MVLIPFLHLQKPLHTDVGQHPNEKHEVKRMNFDEALLRLDNDSRMEIVKIGLNLI